MRHNDIVDLCCQPGGAQHPAEENADAGGRRGQLIQLAARYVH